MEFLDKFVTTIRFLIEGLGVTVSVTLVALGVGFVLGVLMAIFRVYGSRPLRSLAATYSVVVRAVPVVVTIFILYFVIASIVDLSPFLAGSLALGFASGAYQSEIFRGALQSVARAFQVGNELPDSLQIALILEFSRVQVGAQSFAEVVDRAGHPSSSPGPPGESSAQAQSGCRRWSQL